MQRYVFAAVFGAIAAYAQGNSANSYVEGQIVVQTATSAQPDAVTRLLKAHGATIKRAMPELKAFVLQVPEPAADAVVKALARSGQFTFVERDLRARSSAVPNDTSYPSQWHLPQVNAPAAWDLTIGSASVPIAMIDSGVDPTHPDIASRLIPGWSFLTGSTDTHDVYGHGTATAGTVAAATNNSNGVAGLTWNNPVMPLVVLDSTDYASYSNIASAITYAADHGVRVVNISIGGNTASSTLQSAVNYAWNKGAMVFASAMNNGTSSPYYPAACDNVVAVSATDVGDAFAGFSNYGSWVDFSAPGVNILTTNNYGGYGYWSGTSFSSPLAAGVAALILSVNPALSNTAVINIMKQTAADLGTPGFDNYYGWGRIDAYAAVVAARNSLAVDSTAPVAVISAPSNGATVTGSVTIAGSATDNVGVARVDLQIDGQTVTSYTTSAFSFSWNTAGVVNGSHTVTARAYDAAGNTSAASVSVNVNNPIVNDTQPPTVAITSPANGSYLSGSKTVSITVSASDNVGVSQVSVYVDGVQVYTGSSAPYTYNWNAKKAAGSQHTITAKAWDKAGNSSTSAPVTVYSTVTR